MAKRRVLLVVTSFLLSCLFSEAAFRGYVAWKKHDDFRRLRQGESVTEVDTNELGDIVRLSPDPDLVYELKPNLRGRFLGEPIATNAYGMRQPDPLSVEKRPGTFRIVGLGDSYMFGWRVAGDSAYLERFESHLEQDGIRAEALNFAVPGYNTAMEAAQLEHRAAAFEPDLIVVGIVANDMDLPNFLWSGPPTRPLGSMLLGELTQRLSDPLRLRAAPWSPEAVEQRFAFRSAEVPEEYQYMVGYPFFERSLEKIHQVATKLGAKVILFSNCLNRTHHHGFPDLPLRQPERDALWERIDRQWRFVVCPYLLTPEETFPRDGHPTVEGHRRMAEVLYGCYRDDLRGRP